MHKGLSPIISSPHFRSSLATVRLGSRTKAFAVRFFTVSPQILAISCTLWLKAALVEDCGHSRLTYLKHIDIDQ